MADAHASSRAEPFLCTSDDFGHLHRVSSHRVPVAIRRMDKPNSFYQFLDATRSPRQLVLRAGQRVDSSPHRPHKTDQYSAIDQARCVLGSFDLSALYPVGIDDVYNPISGGIWLHMYGQSSVGMQDNTFNEPAEAGN
jgi:hypothetical protein